MSQWKPFTDSFGSTNAFQLDQGFQMHCHGNNFTGPASLQHQASGTRIPMSPGDALYSEAMIGAAQFFGKK